MTRFLLFFSTILWTTLGMIGEALAETPVGQVTQVQVENLMGGGSVLSRAWQGGVIVFGTLVALVGASCFTWAIVVAKWVIFKRSYGRSEAFIKSFWDSRSLNDLNSRLQDYPYSQAREVFRSGYSELVRSSQMRDQTINHELGVHAALDNLNRTLRKIKLAERRKLESYLPLLAISASVCPFVGLFGTVWGIMNAFENIARSGSTSLVSVAPGIAEALVSTSFGLAAAIPAVVAYNLFQTKLKAQVAQIDGFCSDFLNIVERYLVSDRSKSVGPGAPLGHGVERV